MQLYELGEKITFLEAALLEIDVKEEHAISEGNTVETLERVEILKKYLDEHKLGFEQKLEALARIIASEEARADSISKEVSRLQNRKRSAEGKIEALRTLVRFGLEAARKTSYRALNRTFSLREVPKTYVIDESKIELWPNEVKEKCVRFIPKLDKQNLYKIDGFESLAGIRIEPPRKTLVIR